MDELYSYDLDDVFNACFNANKEQIEYLDYISMCEIATIKNENSYYSLVPTWRQILLNFNLGPEYCGCVKIGEDERKVMMTWEELEDTLKLEVERCNRQYGTLSQIGTLVLDIFKSMAEDKALDMLKETITKTEHEVQTTEEPVA